MPPLLVAEHKTKLFLQAYYDLFGEEGVLSGFRTADGAVEFAMLLIGKRWYLANVEINRSIEKQTSDDRKRFLDEFLFVHPSGNDKKLKFGIPASESQTGKANWPPHAMESGRFEISDSRWETFCRPLKRA